MLLPTLLSACLAAADAPVLGIAIEATDTGVAVIEDGSVRGIFPYESYAREERLRLLAERFGLGHINIPLPTWSGRQWWNDRFLAEGWRIQEHAGTEHCRLLDAHGIRRAWGSFAACRTAWEAEWVRGDAQHLRGDVVILLHGLGRTHAMWKKLEGDCVAADLTPVAVEWASTRNNLPEHAARLRELLAGLVEASSVSFVTHSMGGPLLRLAYATAIPGSPPVRGAVFGLAPNRGSSIADRAHDWASTQAIMGPSVASVTHAAAAALPAWTASPALVIAGGQGTERGLNPFIAGDDDGVVAVADTRLDGVPQEIFPVTHTFGMRNAAVRERIVEWLQQLAPSAASEDSH